MTVRSIGLPWWRQLVDRYEIPYFRRAVAIQIERHEKPDQALAAISQFHDLQELHLFETTVSADVLERWRQAHPQVKVTVQHLTR